MPDTQMTWQVQNRQGTYVLGKFVTESSAKDYARWRNHDGGVRRWVARKIETPEKVKVTILWGEQPEVGAKATTYEFDTQGELEAFLKGVSEIDGWAGWSKVPEGYVHAECSTCCENFDQSTLVDGLCCGCRPDEDECENGMHSWVDEVGKLPRDTTCTRCGEPYGDPK